MNNAELSDVSEEYVNVDDEIVKENPSVNYSTYTVVTHLGDVGSVRYEMGYAAAISVFLFGIMAFSKLIIGKLIEFVGK